MTEFKIEENDLLRFASYLNFTDSCWLWEGAKTPDGYGYVGVKGKSYPAHRLSLMIKLGRELHTNLEASHAPADVCGHRNCCNPEHLEEKTRRDNLLDRATDKSIRRAMGLKIR